MGYVLPSTIEATRNPMIQFNSIQFKVYLRHLQDYITELDM